MGSSKFVLVGLMVGIVIGLCDCAVIKDQGEYSIVVAIDENIPQPSDVNAYIQNLQHSLQVFSNELAKATEAIFHIKFVDILIPSSWDVPAAVPAISQSFATADIFLSNDASSPFVDNPNACGVAGNQIQLPKTFFDSLNTGPYGPSWKALLTLWARLRYGVWEEHGYPDHSKFPYFYLGETPDLWEVSSCSKPALVGQYQDSNGDTCEMASADPPSDSCRFHPDPINVATSSLMSFHFIESVAHFCDEDSHNKLAPTRQNIFCNYQSVWEVIRKTKDYEIATSSQQLNGDIPVTTFKVVKHISTARPVYILLDKGALDDHSIPIVNAIVPELGRFVADFGDENDLVTLGQFPGADYESIQQVVAWNTLGENRNNILMGIGDWPTDGGERDFSKVLHQAIKQIEKMNFENGAALIVIKTGTVPPNYSGFEYEEDVYLALARNRIAMHTAEISTPSAEILDLKSLTTRTGGAYVNLNDATTSASNFLTFLEEVAAEITVPADPATPIDLPIYRQFVEPASTPISVDVTKESTVTVSLTIEDAAQATLIIAGTSSPLIRTNPEWGRPDGEVNRRSTQVYIHEVNTDGDTIQFSYTCAVADCSGHRGLVTITEKFSDSTNPHESALVKISVTTSAEQNSVDFGVTPMPFAIYAKVDLDGKPVGNAIVMATVTHDESKYEVPLKDDGAGNPDAESLDGIYSANFVPPVDGDSYTISVHVSSDLSGARSSVARSSGARSSGLLPVDQIEIGCGASGCGSVLLTQQISLTAAVLEPISFSNVNNYPNLNVPERITDFVAVKSLSVTDGVDFRWTVPKVVGNEAAKVEQYKLYGATKQSDLLPVLTADAKLVAEISDNMEEPGNLQHFSEVVSPQLNLLYFAIKSILIDTVIVESELSTVARLTPQEVEVPPTTTTTTQAPPSSTNPPGPTDDPDTTTTVAPPYSFFESPEGIVLIVFLVLLVVGLVGGGAYWYHRKRKAASSFGKSKLESESDHGDNESSSSGSGGSGKDVEDLEAGTTNSIESVPV